MTLFLRQILILILISLLGVASAQANNDYSDANSRETNTLEASADTMPIATAQEEIPKTLTLKDSILLALRYNPSVQSSELQRVIDKFNLRLAENALEVRYALTGTANYTHSISNGFSSTNRTANLTPGASLTTPIGTNISINMNNNVTNTAGVGSFYNPTATVTITQPLLQGFGSTVSTAAAALYIAQMTEEINKLNLKNNIISIVTQVIQQYSAVVQAKNNLTTQELSLKSAEELVDRYRAYIRAGRNAPTDIVQPEANVASQQLNLQQAQNSLQQSYESLLNVLGLDPNQKIFVSDKVGFANAKFPPLKESISLALQHNISYQQALYSLKNTERNYLVAKDQQRWTLNLEASSVNGGGSGGAPNSGIESIVNGSNRSNSVGLNLTVPIDNLPVESAFVNAKIALEQQQINLLGLKRQIITGVTSAYNSLISQKQQIVQSKQSVKLAQQSLDIAYAKQKYGRITPFEVTSLQTALTTAQLTEISSEINYLNSLASYDQLLGVSLDRWDINIRY
jgi:outer membrane protein TolC